MFEPLNVSGKSAMPLLFLLLMGCFEDWFTPYVEPITVGPLSLPTVEHALTVSSKDLFQTPRANNRLDSWKEKHCTSNNSNTDFPYEHTMPLILSVEIDRIQVGGKTVLVDNLTIESSLSSYPYRTIDPLHQEMTSRYDLIKQLLSECRQLEEKVPLALMIAVDERVSTQWAYNILYTLGQAEFSRFAFLVHDPTPSDTPTTELAGGISPSKNWTDDQILYHEDFTLINSVVSLSKTEKIYWTNPGGDTLQGTIHTLPRFLGYASPPSVKLGIDDSPYFQSLMQGYNALYKSGTYCIQLFGGQNESLQNSTPPISTLRADSMVPDAWNQEDKRLPVILIELPMIGGHPTVHRRADGVRCAINIYQIEMPTIHDLDSLDQSPFETQLEKSFKPTDPSISPFK